MIRRLSVAAVAVVFTATVASGCSTFTNNREAAKAGGHKLSISTLESISNDMAKTAISAFAPNGVDELSGDSVRTILNEWISSRLALDALTKAGVVVDDEARAAGESKAKEQIGDANWALLTASTQAFFIEDFAIVNLVNTRAYVSAATAQAAYESGIVASHALCMRYIIASDPDSAADLYAQLQDGADFATLAESEAGGSAPNGGIYADATTGNECVDSGSINQAIAAAVATVPVGEPAAPIVLTGSDGSQASVILLQRPWSEVSDSALPLVRTAIGPDFHDAIYGDAKIDVDSRYGNWDSTTQAVVPAH